MTSDGEDYALRALSLIAELRAVLSKVPSRALGRDASALDVVDDQIGVVERHVWSCHDVERAHRTAGA